MPKLSILSVNVGQPEEIGTIHGVPKLSSIRKRPLLTTGSVNVTPAGLEGDSRVDLEHHGSPLQAIYVLPEEDMLWYAEKLGITPAFGTIMGENLTICGLSGDEVYIGDVFVCGDVRLRVTKVRRPCDTLSLLHPKSGIAKLMIDSERCGWYFEVLQGGKLPVDGVLVLHERTIGADTVPEFFRKKMQKAA